MKLLDVLTAPWAIEPAKLLEIQAIYATHLRGEKIDIEAVEKRLGRPLANEPRAYAIQDGVAIVPMEGVLSKRMNLMSEISGGTSTQLLGRDLQAAMADSAVHSIILAIDSPGGTVDGTQTLADIVSASSKPIVSFASGTMASAAYWVGSAASAIFIADSTTSVGSIGVVAAHKDISKAEEAKGVKTTEISAGQYKRIASSYAPLTKEGRQSIQDQVDYTYGLFVDAVAKQRGVSADTVLSNMADGRVFMGQQAIDAGLVDGVSTLDALVQQLNSSRHSGAPLVGRASSPPPSQKPSRAGAALPTNPTNHPQRTAMLTADQIASDHPDAAAALRAQGASAERARIQAIDAQAIPGHEKLIASLKADGSVSAGDAAIAVLAAEKQSRATAAAALASDAPQPLPAAAAPTVPGANDGATKTAPVATNHAGYAVEASSAQLDADARAHMATHAGVGYLDAVKAVQRKSTQGA